MTEPATAILPPISDQYPDRFAEVAPAHKGPLLSFSGISRYWGRGKGRWAVLRDIDLQVEPGTAICVSGRNGAGKTTLLRIASGILAPDSGTVRIDGMTAADNWREYHRWIGFLSAGDRGLYARVSVRGHLEYWVTLAFVPRAERKQAVSESLERFDLIELATRRADRLSHGQRQRLRLALAFVHRPRLLLLDEPRNSLDAEGLEILASAIGGVLGRGGAVIWCAPAGEEHVFGFDRICLIENGRLVPG